MGWFAPCEFLDYIPELTRIGTLEDYMIERLTSLPTGFRMIFSCHMPSHKLCLRQKIILHYSPPEDTYFWGDIYFSHLLPPYLLL
jgi:hypothetical protein